VVVDVPGIDYEQVAVYLTPVLYKFIKAFWDYVFPPMSG
jgi:hypothetical protein